MGTEQMPPKDQSGPEDVHDEDEAQGYFWGFGSLFTQPTQATQSGAPTLSDIPITKSTDSASSK